MVNQGAYGAFGIPQDIELTVGLMFLMGFIVYTVSAAAFPIWYIALGEEAGRDICSLYCEGGSPYASYPRLTVPIN